MQAEQPTTAPGAPVQFIQRLGARLIRTQAVLTAGTLLVLMVFFGVLFPTKFLSRFNLESLVIDYSGIVLLGVGLTFVMVSARFDLSVGAVLVISGVAAARTMSLVPEDGWLRIIVGLLAALGTGLLIGLLNGFLVVKARVPSLIATLGTSAALLGSSYLLTGGLDLRVDSELFQSAIGFGKILGVPVPVLIALLAVAVGEFILSMTRFGRHTMALGSNEEAARRAGINVEGLAIRLYVISSLGAAMAGFMSLARFGTTTLSGHSTDNLTALLGVVLGGTSLFGGSGTVLGTAVGVFIPGVLANGLILMNVFPYWQQVIVGTVLIAVVYIDIVKRRAQR